MAFKKGWATVAKANKEAAPKGEITKFPSGETKLVKFKSLDDVFPYFAYGVYKKVNTFVPKNPATFNEDGFVESNHTSWDKAAQYYYDRAKDDEANEKALKDLAYKFVAKPRFLIAVYDVETGEDIVVDLTKVQAGAVLDSLIDYVDVDNDGNIVEGGDHDFEDMVFKLSKKGKSTKTTVTLSPVVNLKKGLSDAELANLETEAAKTPIPETIFDGLLFELDAEDMLRGLVAAEFDLANIGEVAPPPKEDVEGESEEEESEPENEF